MAIFQTFNGPIPADRCDVCGAAQNVGRRSRTSDHRGDMKTGRSRPSMDWFKGNNYRKTPYLMGKSMVSCRFSLKPIHWSSWKNRIGFRSRFSPENQSIESKERRNMKKHEERKQLGGNCCWNRTKNACLINCNKTWGLKTVTSHSNDRLVEGCFFSAKMAERRCNLQNNKSLIVRNGWTTLVNAAGCFSRSTMTRVWRKIDLSLL